MTDKELIIEWFESIRDTLNQKFPNRLTEPLVGQRGSEISCINNVIATCNDCIEYIKDFM